jgi:serine/threonine protein kinase
VSQSFETFGKYILLEKLAMGGMAEIYLARNSGASGVSKFFAIKRILPQFTEQPEFIDMFKDEAKIAVNLSHANIVSIYEFGIEKEAFFIAMDFIEGRNLRQVLNKMKKANTTFTIEQIVYVIKEVAGGLDHAHRCIDSQTGKPLNIIHRDMSPQNVMLSFEGEVKVVDFGIAKAETQLETTRAGTLKGKFGYMSPEQAEGQNIDLRTDVFALGIVLWELLANDRLFVANNEVNTLRKIRDCQIPSLRKINPNISPELERIVSKALAKDRNSRYQTAAAFHRELSRFLNRQYPDFSPQDFSVFIKTVFAGEILDSRKKMIDYMKLEAPAPAPPPEVIEKTVVTSLTGSFANDDQKIDFVNRKLEPAIKISAKLDPNAPNPLKKIPPKENAAKLSVDNQSFRANSNQMREAAQMRENNSNSPVRDGAFDGGYQPTYASNSRSTTRSVSHHNNSSAAPMVSLLLIFGLLGGGAAFYYSDPAGAAKLLTDGICKLGGRCLDEFASQAQEVKAVVRNTESNKYDLSISSSPSGAPVEVNGRPSPDTTPMTLHIEKGSTAVISINLAGYHKFEQTVRVDGPTKVYADLKADKKGFVNVIVKGEGQIFINDQLVSKTSPARMVTVPAGEKVIVRAFDPATNAADQTELIVDEGATKTITLSPRADIRLPSSKSP